MDRIEFLQTVKYPNLDIEVFNKAISADPTSEKKFSDWILRMFIKSGLKVQELPSIKSLLSTYSAVRNRMPSDQRDINKFTTPLELSLAVMEFFSQEKSGDPMVIFDKVYEDEKWLMIRPHTYEASIKYSKSTKWCTTAKNMFYSYMSRGYMYILMDKNLPDGDANAKMQFQFTPHGGQFMDALDQSLNILEFFLKNKPIWETFFNAGEFDNGQCKLFKIAHKPEEANSPDVQLLGFHMMGFAIFDIVKKPCPELQKEAAQMVIQTEKWEELKRIGELTPQVQNEFIDYAIRSERKNQCLKKAFSELSIVLKNRGMCICAEVNKMFLQECPKELYLITEPSDDIMEFALTTHPELIEKKVTEYKTGKIKRKWLVNMAIRVPDILQYFGLGVELNDGDAEKVIASKKFSAYSHIRYIRNIPEKLQVKILRKNGVDYYPYFKNPTDRVKVLYKKLKKREDARLKIVRRRLEKNASVSMKQTINGMIRDYNGRAYQITTQDGTTFRVLQPTTTASGGYAFGSYDSYNG